ncbi:hypothetical protein Btru_061513 [Bulinus truncatus]|nr:hypothetical protein Btru_061513 [Bulinus truncatus]
MSSGPDRVKLCGNLNDLVQCVGTAVCPESEKQSTISQGELRLSKAGFNCSAATIATPTTCNLATIQRCMETYIANQATHGLDETLACRDLNDLTTCLYNIDCGTDDRPRTSIITASRGQLEVSGIYCCEYNNNNLTFINNYSCTNDCIIVYYNNHSCTNDCTIVYNNNHSSTNDCTIVYNNNHSCTNNCTIDYDEKYIYYQGFCLARDLNALVKCVGPAVCPESEKQSTISQGELRLSKAGFNCTPTTCSQATIQICIDAYIANQVTHGLDETLACRDLTNLTTCLYNIDCGTDDRPRTSIITASRGQLEVSGIYCTISSVSPNFQSTSKAAAATATTTTLSSTTTPAPTTAPSSTTTTPAPTTAPSSTTTTTKSVSTTKAFVSKGAATVSTPTTCSQATIQRCMETYITNQATHGLDETLACRDLDNLTTCLYNIDCGTDDRPRTSIITASRGQLEVSGIYCTSKTTTLQTTTTKPATTTLTAGLRTTKATVSPDCTNGLNVCFTTFFMNTMSRGSDVAKLCGDQNDLVKCVGAAVCPESEKQSTISQGEMRLLSAGVNCSAKSTSATTTDPCSPDLVVQCLKTYEKAITTHGLDNKINCGDLGVFVSCVTRITCMDDAYRSMLITNAVQQKLDQGISCNIPTPTVPSTTMRRVSSALPATTNSPTTTTPPAPDSQIQGSASEVCNNGKEQCKNQYSNAVSHSPITKELICSQMKRLVSCFLSLNICSFSVSEKRQIVADAESLLATYNIPCALISSNSASANTDHSGSYSQSSSPSVTSWLMFLTPLLLLLCRNLF